RATEGGRYKICYPLYSMRFCRLLSCRVLVLKSNINATIFYFHRIGFDGAFIAREAFSGIQCECFFMEGAGDLGLVAKGADHPAAEDHLSFMGAFILGGVPLVATFEIE